MNSGIGLVKQRTIETLWDIGGGCGWGLCQNRGKTGDEMAHFGSLTDQLYHFFRFFQESYNLMTRLVKHF